MLSVDALKQHFRPNNFKRPLCQLQRFFTSDSSTSSSSSIKTDHDEIFNILRQVKEGTYPIEEAVSKLSIIDGNMNHQGTSTLSSFANIDHYRYHRTRFPEVVFAQSKTSQQVASILDDMAGNHIQSYNNESISNREYIPPILATRYV
jgi:hypothetical protein